MKDADFFGKFSFFDKTKRLRPSLILLAVPEKLPANPPNKAGLFFLDPGAAQELADVAHPVGFIAVADKGCFGQSLFNMFVHPLQIIRVGKIRFIDPSVNFAQSHV